MIYIVLFKINGKLAHLVIIFSVSNLLTCQMRGIVMNRLVASMLLCMSVAPGFVKAAAHDCCQKQKSAVNQELLSVIRTSVISNEVEKVLRGAEVLYSIVRAQVIELLNSMLDQIGKSNEASQALRSWMASLQRAEVPVARRRALPADPGIIFAQRIFDAIENDNSQELVAVIEEMIDRIHLVRSLNIMNIMIVNLSQERLSASGAYATLKECFKMLSPREPVKLPVPVVPPRKKPVASSSSSAIPSVGMRVTTGGAAAQVQTLAQVQKPAQCPIASDALLNKREALKPVYVPVKAASAAAPQIGQHLLRPVPQSKTKASHAVAPLVARVTARTPASAQKTQAVNSLPEEVRPPLPPRNRPAVVQNHAEKQPETVHAEASGSQELHPAYDEWDAAVAPTTDYDAVARETALASQLLYNKRPSVVRSYTPEDFERLEEEAARITPVIQDIIRHRRELLREDEQ